MTRRTSKKAIVSVLFLFCALAVFAKGKAKPRQATLYEHGLSLAALMREKAESSDYRAIVLGANGDLDEKVRELGAGDVSKPTAVYRLSGDFFFLVDMMGAEVSESVNLSSALKRDIAERLISGFAVMWTGKMTGELSVAAASVLQSQSTFVSDELSENCAYIYTFAEGYPVAVSFTKGDGGAVLANASYVVDEDFIPSLGEMLDDAKNEEMDMGLRLEKIGGNK